MPRLSFSTTPLISLNFYLYFKEKVLNTSLFFFLMGERRGTKILFLVFMAVIFIALAVNSIPVNSSVTEKNSIKLLAVSELNNGSMSGSMADLYLDIKPGNGAVYLDTFPLTRIDTQISTRFAKELACRETNIDCNKYDYFYTINSGSAIVGGPSAGSAIAVLTLASLNGWHINNSIAITGTINSGGLIGPVGGLKEKIDAAADAGVKTMLIPEGERFFEENNLTTDLDQYAENKSVKLIEVSDLNDAIYYFTGNRIPKPEGNLTKTDEYISTMNKVADELCQRNHFLLGYLNYKNITAFNVTNNTLTQLENITNQGESYIANGSAYTGASMCFGVNTQYGYLIVRQDNLTVNETLQKIEIQKLKVQDENKNLSEQRYLSVSDLETYMIVKERLIEASDLLSSAEKSLENNDTQAATYNLAYAIERINSAASWSNFFNMTSREYTIDKEMVKNSCMAKISEAEERYQYVKLFVPDALGDTQNEITKAYKDLADKNYELCLFKASKAKAEADMVLSVFGVEDSKVGNVLDRKLEAVKNNIILQESKGFFPILGYSYYEYANSLKDKDKYSALLYAEYSLELSNIDMYFKHEQKTSYFDFTLPKFDAISISLFVFGLLLGALVMLNILKPNIKKKISLNKKVKK